MIQKIIHIVLTVSLLISTTGITVSKHYSGGKLFSTALFGQAEGCCETPCNCCSDKTDHYQLDTDYIQSNFELANVHSHVSLLDSCTFSTLISALVSTDTALAVLITDTSPPPTSHTCALLQVFRC